ncbi:MAG: nucleoid-associated protein [Taibaiella sp.]|jgi:nucleoid-associated protein YejK
MPKEFQQVGKNIDLKGLIIHQVLKDAGDRKATVKVAKKQIAVSDKERVFISKINKAYFKKSSPNYGIFGNENPKFKNSLKEYLAKEDFIKFSVEALNHYKINIESAVSATGGFLIFAHYFNSDSKCDYLLVLTINNKDGYSLSEKDLTIEDIKNLDLSKIDVACMINLTKWNDIEEEIDSTSATYLSFVKGNKDVSYYFMAFIDCADKTTGSEATQRLTTAIKSFCDERGYDKETRIQTQNEIFKYCTDCIDQKKEIQLGVISTMMDRENPHDFEEFASDERFSVSAIISGDKAKLKTIKYVAYKDKKMTIEFDNSLYGKDVIYNKTKKELTFKNLPQQLIDQMP